MESEAGGGECDRVSVAEERERALAGAATAMEMAMGRLRMLDLGKQTRAGMIPTTVGFSETSNPSSPSSSSCCRFGAAFDDISSRARFYPRLSTILHARVAATRQQVSCSLQVQAKSRITFHVGETSITLPFSAVAAKGLSDAIRDLLITFKEKEKATRPQRWSTMEFRQTGEDGVFYEFFCNPNAHANAFQAKVLITIDDEKVKITSEGQLSALKSDLDQFVEQTV